MAVSGFGVGMAATGAFVAYVAITNQQPADALRSLLKGSVTPVPNASPTLAGLPTASDTAPSAGAGVASGLAGAAVKYVGRRYEWGHNFDPPGGGGDCSGLVYRAFHDEGYMTPRLTSFQYPLWSAVKKNSGTIQSGDILWWAGHVAIAVDSGTMVEAQGVGIPVHVVPIRRGALVLTPQLSALQKYAVATSRGQAF